MQQNIHVDRILPRLKVANSKQLLEIFAAQIAEFTMGSEKHILRALLEKSRQENFAIGDGIYIPHLKMPGLQKPFIMLATLDKPVAMKTPDTQPVDIACVLVSPEDEGPRHLHSLSKVARMLKNNILAEKLRDAEDADTLRFLLINPEGWLLAA